MPLLPLIQWRKQVTWLLLTLVSQGGFILFHGRASQVLCTAGYQWLEKYKRPPGRAANILNNTIYHRENKTQMQCQGCNHAEILKSNPVCHFIKREIIFICMLSFQGIVKKNKTTTAALRYYVQ